MAADLTDYKLRKEMKPRIWLFDDEKMILDSLGEFFRAFLLFPGIRGVQGVC